MLGLLDLYENNPRNADSGSLEELSAAIGGATIESVHANEHNVETIRLTDGRTITLFVDYDGGLYFQMSATET